MLSKIRQAISRTPNGRALRIGRAGAKSVAVFQHTRQFARDVADKNPAALVDVMRLLLRPLQTELLVSASEREMHGARASIEPSSFFAPNAPLAFSSYWNFPQLPPEQFRVDLARDPVLPCPWHRTRYVDAVAHIGDGKDNGPWTQDANHRIVLWLPWGIPFVTGGNHSIAAGILSGQGGVVPSEVWDLSEWLDTIETDGGSFIDRATQQRICKVIDPSRAAIFEVGRLMLKHGINPMKVSATPVDPDLSLSSVSCVSSAGETVDRAPSCARR